MSGTATEVLDLVARWVHVIAGIMWVGNSLLFNWLDRSLIPGPSKATDPSLTAGQVWLLHSGGFYYVEKTLLPGQKLPMPLHWFKWQAYTTWLSGMALLVVVYYVGGRAALGDPSVRALSHSLAVVVGIGSIAAGWVIYECMNRFVAPRAPGAALMTWMLGLGAIAFGLLQMLGGRAAFIHVGAMLGTIMAGNVFFTIVPSQRELVASVAEGREASAVAVSARAKRVSIHNNYFTFPVIVLMVSSHFPSLYSHRLSWALLLVLIAGGAAIRHILNIRFTEPRWVPALGVAMITTVAFLSGLMMMDGRTPPAVAPDTGPVTFAEVRHVIDRRCSACHSAEPSDMTFGRGPGGVLFDTPEQIQAAAGRINERAVLTQTMPPANKTNITEAERAVLARWIAQGALR